MEKNSKIYVAGHRGLVGSALVRELTKQGYTKVFGRTQSELDLMDQAAVAAFFAAEKPDYVFMAAAKVGGVVANNTYPADFLFQNLQIQNNIFNEAYKIGVKKLLFLGSSCIYPRECKQPMKEEYLLTGLLEPTNEPYAIAKIAGIKMCQSYNRQYGTNYIAAMPTNLYGENDNFDLQNSHVIPALIRKFHEAVTKNLPTVEVWGTGTPRREFLHVTDMAAGCVYLMNNFNPTREESERGEVFVNLGVGEDMSIKELAEMIQKVSGFTGEIVWNKDKPDGMPQKLLDVKRAHKLGWKYTIAFEDGIKATYEWYAKTHNA